MERQELQKQLHNIIAIFSFYSSSLEFYIKARVQIIIFLVLNVISSKKSIVRLTSVVALT